MDTDEHIIADIQSHRMETADVVREVLFIILGVVGVMVNIMFIYIICYFSKLHTITNIYIVNWAVAEIGSVLARVGYFQLFDDVADISLNAVELYGNAEATMSIDALLFMALLVANCCFSENFTGFVQILKEHITAITAGIWLVSAIYLIVSLATNLWSEYVYVAYLIIFGAFLVFIFVAYGIRLAFKIQGGFEHHPVDLLLIPTVYAACNFLCWVALTLLFSMDIYVHNLGWITDTPVFLHPAINFVLLLYLDENFRDCFFQVVQSCTCCGLIRHPQTRQEDNICNAGSFC